MNGVEEIYVFCNRVRWHSAYLPEVYGHNVGVGTLGQDSESVQETSDHDDDGSFNIDTEDEGDCESNIGNFQLLRWQTKTTLTQLDDQIAAFDNQAFDLREEACFERDSLEESDGETLTGDDSTLNLDDTSFDEDSLYLKHVSCILMEMYIEI